MEVVQIDNYGRKLKGSPDTLIGYTLGTVEIKDTSVVEVSGQYIHPIAIKTGKPEDKIDGVIFEISEEELIRTDEYEDVDYKRVLETFASGKTAWIYIENNS